MLLKYFMSNIQIEFLFAESNKNVGSPVKLLNGSLSNPDGMNMVF